MTCKEISELISLYLDNEITNEEQNILLEHIKTCPTCKKEFEEIKKIKEILNNEEEIDLPEGFHEELFNKIKEIDSENKIVPLVRKPKKQTNFKRYYAVAAIIILGFVSIGSTKLMNQITSYNAPEVKNEAILEEKDTTPETVSENTAANNNKKIPENSESVQPKTTTEYDSTANLPKQNESQKVEEPKKQSVVPEENKTSETSDVNKNSQNESRNFTQSKANTENNTSNENNNIPSTGAMLSDAPQGDSLPGSNGALRNASLDPEIEMLISEITKEAANYDADITYLNNEIIVSLSSEEDKNNLIAKLKPINNISIITDEKDIDIVSENTSDNNVSQNDGKDTSIEQDDSKQESIPSDNQTSNNNSDENQSETTTEKIYTFKIVLNN